MAVALAKTANVCTTNSLSRATVGLRVFDTAGSKLGAEEFNEIVLKLIEVGGVLNVGDFVPVLRWLDPQGVVAKMKKLHRRFDDMMNRIIAERRAGAFATTAGEEGGKDLLGLLLAMVQEDKSLTGAEENKITDTDVKALILNLLVAGTDTTSITVEWAMAELIRHPDIMKQAQEELDAVMGRERLVSESDLPRLTSLSAIIKETFRLHPSTPLSLPRMATEDCKGTELLVKVWGIARDPALWPDPLEFRPARFLPGGSHADVDVKGGDFGLIPFGAGRRICAGLSWGIRMVTVTTATLVHSFDWELPAGQTPDMEETFSLLLQLAVPLMVHPVPRLLPSAYQIA
ncbi:hypothetical protein VPH35_102210 [Triticum aestivum]